MVRETGTIDFGPQQPKITWDGILEMVTWSPRRYQLSTQWPRRLYEPQADGENWRLLLPFCETFRNAFNSMCPVLSHLHRVKDDRCFTFLNDAKDNEETISRVQEWLRIIEKYVAIRDCLALSFALDYNHEGGDFGQPQTRIGKLRTRAKPYDRAPTSDTYAAADELVQECVAFLGEMSCYGSVKVVVAMPPSKPDKPFDLPAHLASRIAESHDIEDLSSAVRTIADRAPIKNCRISEKLQKLEGTIEVNKDSVTGRTILLVDDIYQYVGPMN